MVTEGMDFS